MTTVSPVRVVVTVNFFFFLPPYASGRAQFYKLTSVLLGLNMQLLSLDCEGLNSVFCFITAQANGTRLPPLFHTGATDSVLDFW